MAEPTNDMAGDDGLLRDITQPDQRLQRFKRMFDQAERAERDWRGDVIENRQFLSNEQWTDADRERLKRQKRPMLTINKILPRVLFLKGVQASQREEPDILPFEGGDARGAELIGALYKWFGARCREPRVDSKVFDHKIVAGVGWWKVTWDFDDDPEGRLLWEAADPLTIFADPNWYDSDWRAAEYVIQSNWMHPEDAEAMWPEHAERLKRDVGEWLQGGATSPGANGGGGEFAGDSLSSERSYWDAQTQRLRVLEVWYRKRVVVDAIVRNETGETTAEPERVDFLKQQIAAQPELGAAFSVVRQPVTRVFVAHCTENILLDDQPSPYNEQVFPFFPTLAYYWWRQPFGIVTPIKDLQREKNRRRSTVAEMVGRAALSGFFNHESQGAKGEDLEKYAAGVAKVIPFKSQKPEAIQPPELPQALVFLDTASDRDMDQVSNIHAELLGTTTQRTVSGKAIKARQQSGLLVQEPLLSTFREDKEPGVRFAIGLIKQFCSMPRALRILGSMANRQPLSPLAQQLQAMPFDDVRAALSDAFEQEYDVTISTKPYDPSLQQQRANTLTELAGQFPGYMDPELIVNALKDAGTINEDDAQRAIAFIQQRMMMDQQQQAAATAGQAPAPPNRSAG